MTDKTDNHSISSFLHKQYNMRYLFHCVLIAMVSIVCGCRDCCTRSELFGMWELSDGSIRLLLDLGFEESYLKESFIRLDDDVYEIRSVDSFHIVKHIAKGNGEQWWIEKSGLHFKAVSTTGPTHFFSYRIEKTDGEILLTLTLGDPDQRDIIVFHRVK